MWIDLHAHSVHSDGSRPPEEVAARARQRGVELFCLTDHDSCAGYEATLGACPRVLRGLELSCFEDGRTVHVLLYDAARDDHRWQRLEARLEAMREHRRERVREMAARLARLGAVIDAEAIIARAGERSVGRPDVAQALVTSGAVASVDEAFRRYLHDGGSAYVSFGRLGLAEGLALGLDAGARMSLAHPHILGDHAHRLLEKYVHQGLGGLECYYGLYTSKQRSHWLALAKRLGLVVTGGSDFHGAAMPKILEPGVALPDGHAHRLLEWLGLD